MNTTTTSTTTLCPEHGIVNPIHTATAGRTGPFTEIEAREYAASLGSSIMILGIIQEDDGWYVSYAQKITTTLWYSPDTEVKKTLGFRVALAIVAVKNLIKRWRARE